MGLQATTPQRYISPVEALKQNHIPGWTMEVRVTMHTIRPMPSYATRSSHPPEGGECLDCAHRRTSIASGMARFCCIRWCAPERPGWQFRCIAHSRQPEQSACRVICWLARLVGNPSRVVTRHRTQANHPKGILIEGNARTRRLARSKDQW